MFTVSQYCRLLDLRHTVAPSLFSTEASPSKSQLLFLQPSLYGIVGRSQYQHLLSDIPVEHGLLTLRCVYFKASRIEQLRRCPQIIDTTLEALFVFSLDVKGRSSTSNMPRMHKHEYFAIFKCIALPSLRQAHWRKCYRCAFPTKLCHSIENKLDGRSYQLA